MHFCVSGTFDIGLLLWKTIHLATQRAAVRVRNEVVPLDAHNLRLTQAQNVSLQAIAAQMASASTSRVLGSPPPSLPASPPETDAEVEPAVEYTYSDDEHTSSQVCDCRW